jgi:hypothetical protein
MSRRVRAGLLRGSALAAALLLAGCAGVGPGTAGREDEQQAEIARLRAQLAAEVAGRQRAARAAARREDSLRRQLEAMKAIERGILEREDRMTSEAR